jgi:hypothetical protein
MALPARQTSVKVILIQPVGGSDHVFIEQQPDRPEEVCLAGAIFSGDSVYALLKDELGIREIPVINEAQLRNMHCSPPSDHEERSIPLRRRFPVTFGRHHRSDCFPRRSSATGPKGKNLLTTPDFTLAFGSVHDNSA